MTAMPMEAPMRSPVWRMPPAAPAYSRGTSARERVWFGETTRPCPTPSTSSVRVSHQGLHPARVCMCMMPMLASSPAMPSTMPPSTMTRPTRITRRPATAAAIDPARAAGTPMRPLASAVEPRPAWTYWATMIHTLV